MQEGLFKLLVESTEDCIKVFEKGSLVYFNPAGRKEHYNKIRTGMSVEEWLRTIVPEQRAEVKKALRKGAQGLSGKLVVKHNPKTSKSEDCSLHVFPIRRGHEITGVMTVSRDITSFKKLQEAHEVLSRFPQENPSPVWRIGSKGEFLYRNTAAQQLGALSAHLMKQILSVFSRKPTCCLQYEKNNTNYRLDVVYIKGRQYANMYGIDVTEATRAQQELAKSKTAVEKEVQQRTRELQDNIKELELFKKSVISAELELVKLEKENKELKKKVSEK